MTLWCIIPAKPFGQAKSRLAPQVSPAARSDLAATMFRRTLDTVCSFAGSSRVLVISRSPEILHLASSDGASALLETIEGDMNTALSEAASHALAYGASAVLAVSADLPLLDRADLAAMTADHTTPALAPDRHGTGSNAFFWPGPTPAPYVFGRDSFKRHLAAMDALNIIPHVICRPGLALDIDEYADLCCLQAMPR